MQAIEIVFWCSIGLLIFAYGGYTIFLLPFSRKLIHPVNNALPSCTLLIAAYNESGVIGAKLQNSLELEYPGDLLSIVVVADGSTDETVSVCEHFPAVKMLFEPERNGKLAAIQRSLPYLDSEIIIFSDANSMLNPKALLHMVAHFNDPATGAVSGEKQVLDARSAAATESIYWKYESWLKKRDAAFYSLAGAAGELFCVRRSLYNILPEDTILDDFMLSMLIAADGYIVAYEPRAIATELPSPTLRNEFERKVRIAAGGFQAMQRLWLKISFRRLPRLCFLYYSHRVLRWTIAPVILFLILPLNILLAVGSQMYAILLFPHALVYLLALIGNDISKTGKTKSIINVFSYFFLMNLAILFGFIRFARKQQSSSWEKIPRSSKGAKPRHS